MVMTDPTYQRLLLTITLTVRKEGRIALDRWLQSEQPKYSVFNDGCDLSKAPIIPTVIVCENLPIILKFVYFYQKNSAPAARKKERKNYYYPPQHSPIFLNLLLFSKYHLLPPQVPAPPPRNSRIP